MDNSIYDTESFNYYGFDDARRVITTPSMRYHDVSVRWEGGPTRAPSGRSARARSRRMRR